MKKVVKNWNKATASCVFDTDSYAEHAATTVPKPGIIKFKNAQKIAIGLATYGTLVMRSHISLSF
jgi:hypothetical protein